VKDWRFVCKQQTKDECDNEFEDYGNFDYENVLRQTRDERFWQGRARAVYLLGNKKSFDQLSGSIQLRVLEHLIERIKEENENSLIVNKTALESFDQLVDDYRDEDVFAFQAALDYWDKKQSKRP
jgi:hypothetical protein